MVKKIALKILLLSLLLGFLPITLAWLAFYGFLAVAYGTSGAGELLFRLDILIPCFIFAIWRTWVSHKKLTKIMESAKNSLFDMLEKFYKRKDG